MSKDKEKRKIQRRDERRFCQNGLNLSVFPPSPLICVTAEATDSKPWVQMCETGMSIDNTYC